MSQHHDPVHPDSDHLTPELVADLDEGLLDQTSADHAQHHLDGCSQCREIQAGLAEVKLGLSALPDAAIPTAVEERLFAALADVDDGIVDSADVDVEDQPLNAPAAAATTVVPMAAARSKRSSAWSGYGLGIAASVAAFLLVGALVVPSLISDSDSGSSDEAASAGGQPTEAGTADRINFATSKTGTRYTTSDLGAQVDSLVANSAVAPAATATDTSAGPSSSPTPLDSKQTGQSLKMYREALDGELATNPAAAQACLEDYLDAGGIQPLAIDIGTFVDPNEKVIKPAAVIVLPVGDDPVQAEVWVVDPECSGADSVTLYWAKIDLKR